MYVRAAVWPPPALLLLANTSWSVLLFSSFIRYCLVIKKSIRTRAFCYGEKNVCLFSFFTFSNFLQIKSYLKVN